MKKIALSILLFLHMGVHAQVIITYAGTGSSFHSGIGGLATLAGIGGTNNLHIDKWGNLLLSDASSGNGYIQKIDATSNIISTIAGNDTSIAYSYNGDGGPATCADLTDAFAICDDAAGNLYISQFYDYEIRKVMHTTSIISGFAGSKGSGLPVDGVPATTSKISDAVGAICIDEKAGYLYFADSWNCKVRRINMATNIIETYAGTGTNGYSGDGGPATAAMLSRAQGLALDRYGNVYIGERENARIRRVDATTGIITTIAGTGTSAYSGDGGPATNAMISNVVGICLDTLGNLYFSDETNDRIRRIDAATQVITTMAGTGTPGFSGDGGPATDASINGPAGICIDQCGNIYFSDFQNARVRKIIMTPAICASISDTTTIVDTTGTLGINAATLQAVRVYPNPVDDVVHVDGLQGAASYSIMSVVGSVVRHGVLSKGDNSVRVDGLAAGVYIMELRDGTGVRITSKILKE